MKIPRARGIFLGAMTLFGAGALALAYFLDRQEAHRESAPLPEPAWRSADHSAGYLRRDWQALGAADSTALPLILARLRACDPGWLVPASATAPATAPARTSASGPHRIRMIRTLDSGQRFASEILVASRAQAGRQELELEVARPEAGPLRLRLQLQDGRIAAVQQAAAPPADWQPWAGAENLPLSVGDVPIGEALELCRAFGAGMLNAAGCLEGPNAERQIVFEIKLGAGANGLPGPPTGEPAPAAGVRAFAYVAAQAATLRSVKVLDAKDYVVRVYEDMDWDTPESLGALRITAFTNNSHTVFERDRPAPDPTSAAPRR